jgi:hypothetical protein
VGIPLMKEWIKNNPPGSMDAWDPFPTSLRIVNWIKYLSLSEIQLEESDEIIQSIYQQCLWLAGNRANLHYPKAHGRWII